jgi:mRNA interferase RelE/StbE
VAYIRLTDPAIEDLNQVFRLYPSVLRKVLAKMLILELNTEAGEPLLGDLMGWRKLTVGDRNWRIIWRSKKNESGGQMIEIAQVWAIGARSDSEIYDEMKERLASAPASPRTTALFDVLELFGDKVGDVVATPEPMDSPAPKWLLDRLEHSVGMSKDQTRGLSVEQAMEIWDEYKGKPKP